MLVTFWNDCVEFFFIFLSYPSSMDSISNSLTPYITFFLNVTTKHCFGPSIIGMSVGNCFIMILGWGKYSVRKKGEKMYKRHPKYDSRTELV